MRFAKPASALLPTGFRWRCYAPSKKSADAFTVRTRTLCGHLYIAGVPFPAPGCVQTVQNRVCVARV